MEITRRRGDTKVIAVKFWSDKKNQIPLDITGYSFRLTVDPEIDPIDSSNNLFTLEGVITDTTNGLVQFEPTADQMDITPDTYYFDIEVTDASGKIGTETVDKFIIKQDISK